MKILMIEGARNVGKTHLITNLDNKLNLVKYKFPFASYFNEAYALDKSEQDKVKANSSSELFYLTTGYDITILDLMRKGVINSNLLVDRGILSNIIFGVQAKRISLQEGLKTWDWLCKNYGDLFEVVYIHADPKNDDRNKDMWNIYDQKETIDLYNRFIENTDITIHMFKNTFTNESVEKFNRKMEFIMEDIDNTFFTDIPNR